MSDAIEESKKVSTGPSRENAYAMLMEMRANHAKIRTESAALNTRDNSNEETQNSLHGEVRVDGNGNTVMGPTAISAASNAEGASQDGDSSQDSSKRNPSMEARVSDTLAIKNGMQASSMPASSVNFSFLEKSVNRVAGELGNEAKSVLKGMAENMSLDERLEMQSNYARQVRQAPAESGADSIWVDVQGERKRVDLK
jgi:hypothetical protein